MTDGADIGTTVSSRLTGAVMQKGELMNDLISRQAAINVADAVWSVTGDKNVAKVWDQIKDLPSAQQERKKGKWIYHSEIGWGDTWLCDQCGEKTTSTVMGKPRANYCPMCGADMRGKQDE